MLCEIVITVCRKGRNFYFTGDLRKFPLFVLVKTCSAVVLGLVFLPTPGCAKADKGAQAEQEGVDEK